MPGCTNFHYKVICHSGGERTWLYEHRVSGTCNCSAQSSRNIRLITGGDFCSYHNVFLALNV